MISAAKSSQLPNRPSYFLAYLAAAASDAATNVRFSLFSRDWRYSAATSLESSAISVIVSCGYRQPRNSTLVKTCARQTSSSSSNRSLWRSINIRRSSQCSSHS
uniref:(northern house mosquito) hypothetical protein n=1 Tax=Culex pipiens TaxID=7175 RepID=A0A8D8FAY1_CULPI